MRENNREVAPLGTEKEEKEEKRSVVAVSAEVVAQVARVARFRGRPMVETHDPFPHFTPLHREQFDRLAYPILGGVARSRMGDIFAYLSNTAEDLTLYEHLILFGLEEAQDDEYWCHTAVTRVWDMDELVVTNQALPPQAVWRSPYGVVPAKIGQEPLPFIMSLAGGDAGLYDDIMQSLAPMVMARKPDGVIWWVGDGANGKSTLMDALYQIFPGQLSSITVKRLVDGRDTPSLNGTLANIVKESSEGRVEDTEIYKSIGTHEDFRVHKFHSQDDVEIRGNVHHIFSANSVPTFNDKGYSARRRTFIIPFAQRFESDPTFEERTFNSEMFGRLIAEMCRYAVRIKKQGYRYKWSAATLMAKAEYDTDANNAEEYAKHIIAEGVVAFGSFNPLRIDYENWCADNGYVPLGITNLRRALNALGFERITARVEGEGRAKLYRLPAIETQELQLLGMGRPGMYTLVGFKPEDVREKEPEVPEFDKPLEDPEPEEPKKSVLNGKW